MESNRHTIITVCGLSLYYGEYSFTFRARNQITNAGDRSALNATDAGSPNDLSAVSRCVTEADDPPFIYCTGHISPF